MMPEALGGDKARAWLRDGMRWSEGWFSAFALYAAIVTGLLPILLPLELTEHGDAADIGLVMAALVLGGLSAPAFGRLADRFGLHRELLAGGMLAIAGLLLVFARLHAIWAHALTALLIGAAGGACATVANLFIVEVHPETEWERRIGWLQTFYGLGWVVGLLAASAITAIDRASGLYLAAAVMAAAAGLAWWRTRPIPGGVARRPALRLASRAGDHVQGDPARHHHMLTIRRRRLPRLSPRRPFGRFLLSWALMFVGAGAVFSVFPLFMQDLFGLSPSRSSLVYAVAAFVAIFLYGPAGKASDQRGPQVVYRVGLMARVAAMAALALMVVTQTTWESQAAALCAMSIVIAWPLLSVSGTSLVARHYEGEQGEGMGLFNASTAIAGALGSGLGGWLTTTVHEGAGPFLGTLSMGLGLVLAWGLRGAGADGAKEKGGGED